MKQLNEYLNEGYYDIQSNEELYTLMSTVDDTVDIDKFAESMYTFIVMQQYEKSDKKRSEEEIKDFIEKTKDEVVNILAPRIRQHAELMAEVKKLQEKPTFKMLLKIPSILKNIKSNIAKFKEDLGKLPKAV